MGEKSGLIGRLRHWVRAPAEADQGLVLLVKSTASLLGVLPISCDDNF